MKRILTDEQLAELSEKVKPYLTPSRISHTEGVVKEAARLGALYLPGEENRLRAAAWLHDLTKKADSEKQLQYCREFGIIINTEDELSPKVLHAKTGAALAARTFADYTDEEILAGIRWHTTGRRGMTVFEAILYLADYIEETRTFDDCIALRNFFWEKIRAGENRDAALTDAMIYSFDLTIDILLREHALIDPDTIGARNYYLAKRQTDYLY